MRAANFTNLADIVRPLGGAERAKPAVVYAGRSLSYADLDCESNRIANLFLARGVAPQDRIAVLAKNSACFVAILFATAKAGAVLVPLNWRLSPGEIDYILGDAKPALLVLEQELEQLVPATTTASRLVFADEGGCRFEADMSLIDDSDPAIASGGDDTAMIIYTSGTTGHPKGAMIAHRNFVRHCDLDRAPDWMGVAPDEVCLVVLPLFHVGGLELLLRPLFAGATVILHREVDIEAILQDIGRYKVTMTGLVPTALHMLLQHPRSVEADFSSLRKFLYGAAPITVGLLKEGLERMRCDFIQSYGMTEANGVVVMLAPEDHHDRDSPRLRSAGRPTFGAEIRVVDAEDNDVGPGVIGELLVRSSGIMKGYWGRPEATAETIDPDGWLRSGDAGYVDEDGYVFISDRVKDMICSGGENIYPAEVENAIYGHPSVAEVAVVGVPDSRWGETVRAVVVPKPGATIEADEVIAWARQRIASYKVPRSIEVVDALPKNASGKVLRREVRARVLAQVKP